MDSANVSRKRMRAESPVMVPDEPEKMMVEIIHKGRKRKVAVAKSTELTCDYWKSKSTLPPSSRSGLDKSGLMQQVQHTDGIM